MWIIGNPLRALGELSVNVTIHLRLIGKRVVDVQVLIELLCLVLPLGATSENRLKISPVKIGLANHNPVL